MRTLSACILLMIGLSTGGPALGAETSSHFWSRSVGGAYSDNGYAVAIDEFGNIFAAGSFLGTANFGGGDLVSAGGFDIWIAKYDVRGGHRWSRRFGGTGDDVCLDMAVNRFGAFTMTGSFTGTVDFGGGPLTSVGNTDAFLIQYGADGSHVFSKRYGSTGADKGSGISLDRNGHVRATGSFEGTVNFGGTPLTSAGSADIFVLALSSGTGSHLWSARYGSTSFDSGESISVNPVAVSAEVVVTGYFSGDVNFGGSTLSAGGPSDAFLAKYSIGGVHQWSLRIGSAFDDRGIDVDMNANGDILATGVFQGTVGFPGGNLASAGGFDVYVARYGGDGVGLWARRFGGTTTDWGYGVAFDPYFNNRLVATGSFEGSVDFGNGAVSSVGGTDMFLVQLDALGTHQWSQRFGDSWADQGSAVAMGPDRGVALVGVFDGTQSFGGPELISDSPDVVVAKFGRLAAEPAITSIEDVGNDQGRKVRIRFDRSGVDDPVALIPVTRYVALRRDDPPPASSRTTLDDGWTEVGSVSAFGKDTYGIDVPTVGDSTIAQGLYLSTFVVRAATDEPRFHYDSGSAAGYSVDNLAPGIPGSLAVGPGGITWAVSRADDFDYFSVYGGSTNSFGAATLIGYTTSLQHALGGHTFYFVTATDFAGNEGKPAVINALTGIGESPASHILSVSAYPNPFNPQTTIRYTIPSTGRVTIAVFDARGALVTTLIDDEMEAGAYTEPWDARDANGAEVGSGVYFARVAHATGTKSYKMVLLK